MVIGGPDARIRGPTLVTGTEPVAKRERGVAPIAEVSNRGDTSRECTLSGKAHTQKESEIVILVELANRVGGRVEGEVLMDIDEPGKERDVAEIDDIAVECHLGTRADRDDAAVRDLDCPVFDDAIGEAGEEAPTGQQHDGLQPD